MIKRRREKYFQLSSQLASLDNTLLRRLLADSASENRLTNTVTIDQSKVFVKRIPVAALEYENVLSTRNLYDLPTYFNYGLGSVGLGVAGLNVFRELVTHIKTTHWVLSSHAKCFTNIEWL